MLPDIIPARDAMILWTPAAPLHQKNPTAGGVAVTRIPEAGELRGFVNSAGACYLSWSELDDDARLKELNRLVEVMVHDGVPRDAVIDAMSVIEGFARHPESAA